MSPREKILATAIKLISEKGFFNTATAEIVEEAQVDYYTFYKFFADKNAILEEIFSKEWEKRYTFYTNIKTWRMDWFLKINGILNFHLQEIQKEPEITTIIITEEMNPLFREKEIFRKYAELSSIIAEILQQAVDEQKIIPCDVQAISFIITGFIKNLNCEYLQTQDFKRLEQAITNFCDLLKRALEITQKV